MLKQIIKNIDRVLGKAAAGLVFLYQKTLSPDHSFLFKKRHPYGFCRFYPTCSEFSRQVFLKRGFLIGFLASTWQILNCNPWTKPATEYS